MVKGLFRVTLLLTPLVVKKGNPTTESSENTDARNVTNGYSSRRH